MIPLYYPVNIDIAMKLDGSPTMGRIEITSEGAIVFHNMGSASYQLEPGMLSILEELRVIVRKDLE